MYGTGWGFVNFFSYGFFTGRFSSSCCWLWCCRRCWSRFLGISNFDHLQRSDRDLFSEGGSWSRGSSGLILSVILRRAGCVRGPPIPCQLSATTLWDRPCPLLRVVRLPGLASCDAGCSLAGVVGLLRGTSSDSEVPAPPRRGWEPYNPEPLPTGSSAALHRLASVGQLFGDTSNHVRCINDPSRGTFDGKDF